MKQNESINNYYHIIFKLGQHVETPKQNKIEEFLISVKPTITTSLINEKFTDIGELMNRTKMIENRKKEITNTHFNKKRNNRNKNGNNNNNTNNENSDNINKFREKLFNVNTNKNPNKKIFFCSTKFSKGSDKGYDPKILPKKLKADVEKKLIKTEKCGKCRKLGHKKNDEKNGKKVCFMQAKRLNTQIVETNSDFNFDFESEKT